MYAVKIHIILRVHQKKKKTMFSMASEHLHWIPSQSFLEYQMYLECFHPNKPGEGAQYLRCLTLDRTQTKQILSLYGRKKGMKRKCFLQCPCLLCGQLLMRTVHIRSDDLSSSVRGLLLVLFAVVLVLSKISSYGASVTCHFGVRCFCVCLSESAAGAGAPPVGRRVK